MPDRTFVPNAYAMPEAVGVWERIRAAATGAGRERARQLGATPPLRHSRKVEQPVETLSPVKGCVHVQLLCTTRRGRLQAARMKLTPPPFYSPFTRL